MSEHFDWPQVNHYLWRRQGFAWDQGGGAGRLLDEVIGVYATSPTGYLTLLAREAAFRFADLDDALYAARRAVRMRAMRYSNFILPIRSLPAVYQATKRDQANPFKELLRLGMTEAQYEDAARQIEELLADGATRTAAEVRKALPADITAVGPAFGYVLPQMCEEARLVRARVRGGWKSDLYEYARFDHWLPDVHLDEVSPEDGQMELARLYFDAYVPTSAENVSGSGPAAPSQATRIWVVSPGPRSRRSG